MTTLPEVHLANEAVAALVDGELSRTAYDRAITHTMRCAECRQAVQSQREAKAALTAACLPEIPFGLFTRLHDVPMTADVFGPGGFGGSGGGLSGLAMADGQLVLSTLGLLTPTSPFPSAHRADAVSVEPAPRQHRPLSQPLRRGIAGTVAGLAFGVLAAAAPTGAVATGGGQVVPAGNNPGQVVPASVSGPVSTLRQRDEDNEDTLLVGVKSAR